MPPAAATLVFVAGKWTVGQVGRRVRLAGFLLLALVLPGRTAEGEEELLARLKQPTDASTLHRVAYELGKLKSVKGLDALLAMKDQQAIYEYEHGSWEGHDRGVLPADVEEVIVRHCEDPGIGVTLTHLVRGRYRTRALFDCFARRLRQPDLPSRSQFAYTIVRTDLPVEAEILDLMKQTPRPAPAALSIQEIEQTRYAFYHFFAERRYAPAAPVIAARLREAGPFEGEAACDALAKIGTPEAVAAVVEHVRRLRSPPPDAERAARIAKGFLTTLAQLPPETPIDLGSVRRVLPDSPDRSLAEAYVSLVAHRGDARGLPDLLRFIARDEPAGLRQAAIDAVLSLDSPDAWRAAEAELQRVERGEKIDPARYASAHRTLQERLADPEGAAATERARRRDAQRSAELEGRLRQLEARLDRSPRELVESDPKGFLTEEGATLPPLEALLSEYGDTRAAADLRRRLVGEYLLLASVARFRLHDPHRALVLYEKAAGVWPEDEGSVAGFAIGDTWEYDLGDRQKALEAYGTLLAKLRSQIRKGTDKEEYRSFLDWWAATLEQESQFLAHGAPFSGRLPRSKAAGIYIAAFFLGTPFVAYVPELFAFEEGRSLEQLDRAKLASTLRGLPASHLLLLQTIPLLALLPPAEMIDYLERQDPGRFWAASLLTTAVLVTGGPDQGSEFRLFPTRDQVAKIGGNPFPEAARRFTERTGIVLDVKPEERFPAP